VRSHQHRYARLAQALQQFGEFIGGFWIEAGGRLVEQQRFGLFGERNRDSDFLPHAFRVSRDPFVGGCGWQAYFFEESRQLLARVICAPGEPAEVCEILQPRQVAIEHDLFGDVGEVAFGFQRLRGDVESLDFGRARRRLDEVEKQVDGRGLARAVGAEQTEDLARLDLQVE
jgi:hypothetical protein